jgi:hypothetical protein
MDIETRLESLENDIRRQKDDLRLHKRLGLAVACALALSLAISAAGNNRIIEARKFILRDAAGRPVCIWEGASGGPLFVMTDGAKGRLSLTIRDEGAGLIMTDSRGRTRLQASVVKKLGDVPGFTLMDKNGETQMLLAANNPTNSLLTIRDTSANRLLGLGLSKGNPIISQKDSAGKLRASLQLLEKGEPGLRFYDGNSMMRATVGIFKGRPSISLLDASENTRTTMSLLDDDDSLLWFKDKKG